MDLDEALVRIAYDLAFNQQLPSLCIWWSKNNQKPLFHPNLEEYTEEELIIEWFIYRLIDDPKFKKETEEQLMGEVDEIEEWLKKEMGEGYVPPDKAAEMLSEALVAVPIKGRA